jgi:Nickel responsive protein SCO4226-like
MPRYIIERNMDVKGMSKQDLDAAARLSKEIIATMPGVVWIKSFLSEAEGKVYCEYDAPNVEAILEHARRGGFPADRVVEVSMEVSPDMFK